MKKGRVAVVASILTGLGGASIACSAVLGIADFTAGDGGAGPRDAAPDHLGPGGGDGGPGGEAGLTCADQDGGAGVIGCGCNATTGCNGYAQTERLVCSGSTWALSAMMCSAGTNCDTRPGNNQGTCQPLDPSCADAAPGQQLCIGSNVILCGPDLVSETPVTTCSNQACVDGGCTGVCTPGAAQCTGTGVQTCSPSGAWSATSACSELCADGGCASFPSCMGGAPGAGNDCSTGDGGTTDCCSSYDVAGGTFYRSYDAVSPGDTSMSFPATVSGFRLDAYEVTVGRFRQFVTAAAGGWRPTAGAGKHTHLNAGGGLTNVGGDAGGSELGWSSVWSANLSSIATSPNATLACDPSNATWTASAGSAEGRPINCVSWYEAYAFCIWDGGFLPSEAEWNYAASGGTQQRVYPWSSPATSSTIDCTYANYNPGTACSSTGPNTVGSESANGNGRWGHADLAGNLSEWTLDTYAPYHAPCADCANLSSSTSWVARGGSFNIVASALLTSYRFSYANRDVTVGVRCARTP